MLSAASPNRPKFQKFIFDPAQTGTLDPFGVARVVWQETAFAIVNDPRVGKLVQAALDAVIAHFSSLGYLVAKGVEPLTQRGPKEMTCEAQAFGMDPVTNQLFCIKAAFSMGVSPQLAGSALMTVAVYQGVLCLDMFGIQPLVSRGSQFDPMAHDALEEVDGVRAATFALIDQVTTRELAQLSHDLAEEVGDALSY